MYQPKYAFTTNAFFSAFVMWRSAHQAKWVTAPIPSAHTPSTFTSTLGATATL